VEPISPELVLVDPQLAQAVQRPKTVDPFRVAFVCTGNRFRSALAEAAFRAATDARPLEVASYGILDLGAAPPLPQAVRAAAAYGLEISGHVARPLDTADLSKTSLVVGFEVAHCAAAIERAGARVERTFLLLELVDMIDEIAQDSERGPIPRAAAALDRAHAYRRANPTRWSGREIPDPVQLSEADQPVVGRVVFEEVTRLARGLFGPVGAGCSSTEEVPAPPS
jgi:protein-tyrosine-phosphatase